jgi:hypothetical protein
LTGFAQTDEELCSEGLPLAGISLEGVTQLFCRHTRAKNVRLLAGCVLKFAFVLRLAYRYPFTA